ncbi:MAG: cobyrinate a,c-diamide synthase [Candidatus Bathyarchaeia archaeon]
MNIPRVIIGGICSGVGKTTISIGLMNSLREAGFTVQAFKVGPDYIDPSYHKAVTQRPSENLDAWMLPRDQIIEIFRYATVDADIALIEGVMGLYDGISGVDEAGSTAHIAKILRCPVILIIDVYAVARSAGAIALGYQSFDKDVKIAGIILNRVGNSSHALWCKNAIENATRIPVIGALPVNENIVLSERHLGLIPTVEKKPLNQFFTAATDFIKKNVDLNAIIRIAKSAPELPIVSRNVFPTEKHEKTVTIGVAFDEAFNFYYPSSLKILEAYGAEIKYFSPIHDGGLPPNIDGCYIGGGFPEMLAKNLEENVAMRQAVRKAAEDEMPIYAECGGLMYLTDEIVDFEGRSFQMAGLLHAKTVMTKKVLLNYATAEVISDNLLSSTGDKIRGHEFHSSKIVDIPVDAKFAYLMKKGEGIDRQHDGWLQHNVLASYLHIHFAQNADFARCLIEKCRKYHRQ